MMVLLKEIKEKIDSKREHLGIAYNVNNISVFGSYAKNNQTDESDLDLLVEFTKPVSLLKLIALENYLSDLLDLKVDLVPKENLRTELEETIIKEALSL
jgi:uncharacterized protein